jgi:hypothetical protein
MADILAEDEMWDLVEIVKETAVFRRTRVKLFGCKGSWMVATNL